LSSLKLEKTFIDPVHISKYNFPTKAGCISIFFYLDIADPEIFFPVQSFAIAQPQTATS